MRDTKVLKSYTDKIKKDKKEKELFKNLKKEVQINGNGTNKYFIKNGINKGKLIWVLLQLD